MSRILHHLCNATAAAAGGVHIGLGKPSCKKVDYLWTLSVSVLTPPSPSPPPVTLQTPVGKLFFLLA